MAQYVALLRGVGPGNPNMHQKKLVSVVEGLGFSHVKGVISSGNVVFESDAKNTSGWEDIFEKAWPAKLGFHSTTIIRSQAQLKRLVAKDPFKTFHDEPRSRLNVTFLKNRPEHTMSFPWHGLRFQVLGIYDNAVCSVLDLSDGKTPGLFNWLDKQYGPGNTSRTWKTVQRIIAAME